MAEPLKDFFSADVVQTLASELARVLPTFPVSAFVRDATKGLAALELLARGKHIAAALAKHLPQDYPTAIGALLASLGPEHATDELVGAGMSPFFYLPHVTFVAERGLDHFELSMKAQYELTKRFTAEFSIRPFIEREPKRTMAALRGFATDPNAHVRRLAAEGTRLRLPWAKRVAWLERNPERVLELLELLKDDPTSLVRRSVANNLNDLGKVHPKLMIATCKRWLARASSDRRALVEHALRSAIKRGDPAALALVGYGQTAAVRLEGVSFTPRRVAIGKSVALRFGLKSTSRASQELLVDLRVHFVKSRGHASPKVFKLRRVTLPAGGRVELGKRLSLAVHSTRKPRRGLHAVEVLVNGRALDAGSFEVC